MTTAYWCVLVAALLPYVSVIIAKASPNYNNAAPRVWLQTLDGWRARANWAHQNAFEAFPAFAAGVIIAHLAQAPQGTIDMLALIFIVARLAYLACYILNQHVMRSLLWTVGFGCTVGFFISAGMK